MNRFLKKKADACPKVHIANATKYPVKGKIAYIHSDETGGRDGSPSDNKVRKTLVTEITAVVSVNGDKVQAAPFSSAGIFSDQFAVVQNADGYAVTCIDNALTEEFLES